MTPLKFYLGKNSTNLSIGLLNILLLFIYNVNFWFQLGFVLLLIVFLFKYFYYNFYPILIIHNESVDFDLSIFKKKINIPFSNINAVKIKEDRRRTIIHIETNSGKKILFSTSLVSNNLKQQCVDEFIKIKSSINTNSWHNDVLV